MERILHIGETEHTVRADGPAEELRIGVDGETTTVSAVAVRPGEWSVLVGSDQVLVRLTRGPQGLQAATAAGQFAVELRDPRSYRASHARYAGAAANEILAPMPGKLVRLLAAVGSPVAAGQAVAVVEAMKMQNDVRCPSAGTIAEIRVAEGDSVAARQVLLVMSAE